MRHGCRRLSTRRWTGAILTLSLIAPLACQPRVTPETVAVSTTDWSSEGLTGRTLRTDHFDIHSTLIDTEFENALPVFLEAAYAQFEKIAPTGSPDATRLQTYIFTNRPEWHHFSHRRFPTHYDTFAAIQSGGFTRHETSVVFYTMRDATFAALAHEAWHQFANTRLRGEIPAWLNEGLACYHETFRYFGDEPQFIPRRNAFRMNTLCEAVNSDRLLSLEDLLTFDVTAAISAGDTQQAHLYYAQLWALVTFLKDGADGRYHHELRQLIKDVAQGNYRARAGAAALTNTTPTHNHPDAAGFYAYFQSPQVEIAAQYYDFLIRTCGF